jgi:hypothetical protein
MYAWEKQIDLIFFFFLSFFLPKIYKEKVSKIFTKAIPVHKGLDVSEGGRSGAPVWIMD